MTAEYEEKLRREREELYAMRRKHEAEMLEERDRVIALLRKRGIQQATKHPFDRVVTVENHNNCLIEHTCFQIPEDIDLKKVVQWFVHNTKYYCCTVFLLGWNPTTIANDDGIDYFFKYAPAAHEKFMAKHKED